MPRNERVFEQDRVDSLKILEAMDDREFRPINVIVKASGVGLVRTAVRIKKLGQLVEQAPIPQPGSRSPDRRIFGYRRTPDAIEKVRSL